MERQQEAQWALKQPLHPKTQRHGVKRCLMLSSPSLMPYMPIGSHHTWYGLLFVKGLVGLLGFAVPLLVHILVVARDAIGHVRGRLPLGILMTMVLLSFGENIEIEAYLLWPGLLLLGVHLRELSSSVGTKNHHNPGFELDAVPLPAA